VGGDVVIHHLEIDGVLLFHGGDPALGLLAVTGDVENPILAFTDEAVGGCARRDRSPINGYREGASEGAEARIDHISGAADCDGDKHVLSHAFVARLEQDDTGCVSDGSEADRIESGIHEAWVFEAVAAGRDASGRGEAGTVDRRFPPPRSIEERPESVFVVPGRDRPRAVSASRSVLLGPLLAVANFRQMQGKFARVP
jgi:hypothetical protein